MITQADDEATTKKVHVEFPKGTGINIASTIYTLLRHRSCSQRAVLSHRRWERFEAESRLLPSHIPANNGALMKTAGVYLTGREGNKLTLSAQLSGFIDLQLDATAGRG